MASTSGPGTAGLFIIGKNIISRISQELMMRRVFSSYANGGRGGGASLIGNVDFPCPAIPRRTKLMKLEFNTSISLQLILKTHKYVGERCGCGGVVCS